jgi:hypothetical protein
MTRSNTPATWKGVRDRFAAAPAEVRGYFTHYPKLLEAFPWDVSIGYLFTKVEQAHRIAIYCGVVKLHRVDASLAETAVDGWHMSREDFRSMFRTVFSARLPDEGLVEAEKIRDRVLHGTAVSASDHRLAAVRLLDYADELSGTVTKHGGASPFGDLRGFKGRATALEKSTSRLVLKGLGFKIA